MSTPNKLRKRYAPSRSGSDTTEYSSSSTLVQVLEERFSTPEIPTPSKPWAIEALNQLRVKCKKSMDFGKRKKKEPTQIVDPDEPHISPYTRTPPPFVLDISREAVTRTKARQFEEDDELLPDPPHFLMRAPSTNTLRHARSNAGRSSDLRMASTPDLRLRSKRDSQEDPFNLDKVLGQFPEPPAYRPKANVRGAPLIRRYNSNFSLPNRKGQPEQEKRLSRNLINRPVRRDMFSSIDPPTFSRNPGVARPIEL